MKKVTHVHRLQRKSNFVCCSFKPKGKSAIPQLSFSGQSGKNTAGVWSGFELLPSAFQITNDVIGIVQNGEEMTPRLIEVDFFPAIHMHRSADSLFSRTLVLTKHWRLEQSTD